MKQMEEIKRCRCGGLATFDIIAWDIIADGTGWISCSKCGMRTKKDLREQSIKVWNAIMRNTDKGDIK